MTITLKCPTCHRDFNVGQEVDEALEEPGLEESIEVIESSLRHLYPHGHAGFIFMCLEEMRLHSDKNHDYASKERPLQNFYDAAAIFALFPGLDLSDPTVVALVYMVKQLVAVLHLKADGITAIVEGIERRMKDVGVFAKLVPIIEREKEAR